MAYSFDGRVRFSELGEDGSLSLPGILNYFQDSSTFQSEDLGQGKDTVVNRNRVWVLSFWQVVVKRRPKLGERIVTSTWPYEFRAFIGSRNFKMDTADGEALAWANTLWSYLEMDSGKPAKLTEDDIRGYELEPKLDMEYSSRKIAIPSEFVTKEPFLVQKHHLDTNHHVNNVQSVCMAADFLPEGFEICEMRAEYRKQVFLGDVLSPYVTEEEGKVTVVLRNQEQAVCTVVQFFGQ